MSNQNELISKLEEAEAILKGHFILSSGLHSDTYIQCAKIFSQPQKATEFCKLLVEQIQQNHQEIDVIVAPAMGGVIIGYEIARQLGKPNIFCERVDGNFTLRRGFNLEKGQKVLIVEDVVTTGKSSIETAECIKAYGAEIVGEACLINRSGKENPVGDIHLTALVNLEIATFPDNEIPTHLADIPAIKPGSRFLKK